jgi:hypothetical protein
MIQWRVRRFTRWMILAIMAACFSIQSHGQSKPSLASPDTSKPKVNLQLRIDEGRTSFHIGEIVPIELIYSSSESTKVLFGEDCMGHGTYKFRATPDSFIDRVSELDAAGFGGGMGMNCHGFRPDAKDLSKKPYVISLILNNWFRMETAGHYKIAVTAHRSGFPVTSDPVDLEILPPDPDWEKLTLAHAIALMDTGETRMRGEGCQILGYLPSEAAEREMARRYRGIDYCDQELYPALINAHHRKAVLDELEARLTQPDLPITAGYLGMLAKISLYQRHPDWYPAPLTKDEQIDPTPDGRYDSRSMLWKTPDAIQQEELHYAEVLYAAISHKTGEACAVSLKTLLELDETLMGGDEVPAKFDVLAQQRIPQVFLDLPFMDQDRMLMRDWPLLRSAAMIPPLKQMVGVNGEVPPMHALLRLAELSPDDAGPILIELIKNGNATYSSQFLSRMPDLKFPELDSILLAGVKNEFPASYHFEFNTAMLNRYGSAAISGDVRVLVQDKIGTLNGRAEATLIAYFLRVDPQSGMTMLHKEIASPGRADFQFLLNLADATSPKYVEQAALLGLDSSDPQMLYDALSILRRFGTAKSAHIVLDHFRQSSERWKAPTPGIAQQTASNFVYLEESYLDALASPLLWLPSPAQIRALQPMCVSRDCM